MALSYCFPFSCDSIVFHARHLRAVILQVRRIDENSRKFWITWCEIQRLGKAWQSSSKRRVLQYITMKRGASNAVLIVNFRDANMQNLDQPPKKIFPRSFQQILNLEINQPP